MMKSDKSKEEQYVIGVKYTKVLQSFANASNYKKRQQAFAAYERLNRKYNPRPEKQK